MGIESDPMQVMNMKEFRGAKHLNKYFHKNGNGSSELVKTTSNGLYIGRLFRPLTGWEKITEFFYHLFSCFYQSEPDLIKNIRDGKFLINEFIVIDDEQKKVETPATEAAPKVAKTAQGSGVVPASTPDASQPQAQSQSLSDVDRKHAAAAATTTAIASNTTDKPDKDKTIEEIREEGRQQFLAAQALFDANVRNAQGSAVPGSGAVAPGSAPQVGA